LKRPVALMFGLYRGGNRYDIHIERFFDSSRVRGVDRDTMLEQLVEHYAQRVEHHCRQAPYNWFNFYDYWR
ncbi:MAG: acyl-CoA synthetase, partial [Burkholderiales bacterium]